MTKGLIQRGGSVEELEAELAALEAAEAAKQGNVDADRIVADSGTSGNSDNLPDSKVVVSDETTSSSPPDEEDEKYKKRYGDLRRYSQKKENELNKRITELEDKLRNIPAEMPQNEEDVKKWVETNPLATAIIKKIALEEASKTVTGISTQIVEINKEKELAKIHKAHPDFDEITTSDEFQDWADEQPDFIQDKIFDNENAKDVIWALNLYKQINAKEPSPSDTAAGAIRRKAAGAPSTKKNILYSESMIQKNNIDWYEKHQTEIEAAIRSGEFEYDISGAAR